MIEKCYKKDRNNDIPIPIAVVNQHIINLLCAEKLQKINMELVKKRF